MPEKVGGPAGRARFGDGHGRRRLALGAGVLALVAVLAAVALAGGGSDGGQDDASDGAAGNPTTTQQRSKLEPEPLTRSELIAQADEICAESQRRYREIHDLEREMSADVPYAQALVRFASERISGLRALTPPPELAGPYGEYVQAQERVYDTDKEALAAAKKGNAAGVEAARAQRDAEDAERYELARAVGLKKCSSSG